MLHAMSYAKLDVKRFFNKYKFKIVRMLHQLCIYCINYLINDSDLVTVYCMLKYPKSYAENQLCYMIISIICNILHELQAILYFK